MRLKWRNLLAEGCSAAVQEGAAHRSRVQTHRRSPPDPFHADRHDRPEAGLPLRGLSRHEGVQAGQGGGSDAAVAIGKPRGRNLTVCYREYPARHAGYSRYTFPTISRPSPPASSPKSPPASPAESASPQSPTQNSHPLPTAATRAYEYVPRSPPRQPCQYSSPD